MADTDDDGLTLHWFHDDLRLGDNPALRTAVDAGRVVCVFVLDEESDGRRGFGGAARWWLHHSLAALSADIEKAGGALILRRGKAAKIVAELAEETGAATVTWNMSAAGPHRNAEAELKDRLRKAGIEASIHGANLLHDPATLTTSTGGNYKTFTPFWRTIRTFDQPVPLPTVTSIRAPSTQPQTENLDDWGLLPTKPDWAAGLRRTWSPGEAGARSRLEEMLDTRIADYADHRDEPAFEATSRLSPHLRSGEISVRQIWHATGADGRRGRNEEKFLSELAWRDFNHHLLFHNRDLATANYDKKFNGMRWLPTDKALEAWQRGRTGYPIVDAAMRQLWETGWMHNRMRLVTASFLTKHLLIDWRRGEEWFWDTLVDADPANNPGNWQWVAGTGADAAPYFRIFNPILQSRKFDSEGTFIRSFVPELARLEEKAIHAPWEAKADHLQKAGISLGEDYPKPIVDHGEARERALSAYGETRGT